MRSGVPAVAVPPGAHARALADRAFRARYLDGYRGDADPLDALWWLEHPDAASPSGAEPPRAAARRARRRVYAPGATAEALDAAVAAERRADEVHDAAHAALRQALGPDPVAARPDAGPGAARRRMPRRRLLPLLGVAAAAVAGAAALAALPGPHVDRPAVARSLQAVFPGAAPRPADLRLAVSGAGPGTVTRDVRGSAPLRVTTVLCRGAGRIEVRLSDRPGDGTGMLCVAGRARLTRLLDAMPAAEFLTTVVVAGPVAWSVTVADEAPRYDATTYPRCFGAEC